MKYHNIKYLISKLIYKIQIPSCKGCEFAPNVKILPKTNLLNVKVGKYTYIGANNSMQDVEIGAFCSIGSYVSIGGGLHPMDIPSTSPVFYESSNCFRSKKFLFSNDISYPQIKTKIGNDVWIGDKVYIRAGVIVGDGAVIGANSVVTKDVPPYAIVAGCPAKILRYRFEEEAIKKMLNLKWWEWDDKKISENRLSFASIDKLLGNNPSKV